MNRFVGVVHPWANDPEANRPVVETICASIEAEGNVPIFAPFVFPWLDDVEPGERSRGLEMACYLIARCREVRAYGAPTEGMRYELAAARAAGIPVKWMMEQPPEGEW